MILMWLSTVLIIIFCASQHVKSRLGRPLTLPPENCQLEKLDNTNELKKLALCYRNIQSRRLYEKMRQVKEGEEYSADITANALAIARRQEVNLLELHLLTQIIQAEGMARKFHVLQNPYTSTENGILLFSELLKEKNQMNFNKIQKALPNGRALFRDVLVIAGSDANNTKQEKHIYTQTLEYHVWNNEESSKVYTFVPKEREFSNVTMEDELVIKNTMQYGRAAFAFLYYYNAHELLNGTGEDNVTSVLDSRIIAATMYQNYTQPPVLMDVLVTMSHLKVEKHRRQGVFMTASGNWNNAGCFVLNSNEKKTTFQCKHLANFAVAIVADEEAISVEQWLILSSSSITGCIVSFVCGMICFFLHAATRVQKLRSFMMANFSFCLTCAQGMLLLGLTVTVDNEVICIGIAFVTHYFLLASAVWLLVLGLTLQLITYQFNQIISTKKKAVVIAYTFPSLLMIVTLAMSGHKALGHKSYCWLTPRIKLASTSHIPLVCTLCINIVILVLVVQNIGRIRTSGDTNMTKKAKKIIRVLIFTSPLLVLTWLSGVLVVKFNTMATEVLFTTTNCLLGVVNVTLNGLFDTKVRKNIIANFRKVQQRFHRQPTSVAPEAKVTSEEGSCDSTPSKG